VEAGEAGVLAFVDPVKSLFLAIWSLLMIITIFLIGSDGIKLWSIHMTYLFG
jgi:hypothetical protein